MLVLHFCLLFGKVDFRTEIASDSLVDEAVRADRVISQHEKQVNHAHVSVTDTLLPHRLIFKGFDQVLEAICALFLIVNLLLRHEGFDRAADVVLVRVLV